jgi:hypothetical protein
MNRKRTIQLISISIVVLFVISSTIPFHSPSISKIHDKYSVRLENPSEAYTNESILFKAIINSTLPPQKVYWKFNHDGIIEKQDGHQMISGHERYYGGEYNWSGYYYCTVYSFEKKGSYRVDFYIESNDSEFYHKTIKISIINIDIIFSLRPIKEAYCIGENIKINATIENHGRLPIPLVDFKPLYSIQSSVTFPDGKTFWDSWFISTWDIFILDPFSSTSLEIGAPYAYYKHTDQGQGYLEKIEYNQTGRYLINGYYESHSGNGFYGFFRTAWTGQIDSIESSFEIIS